MKKLIFGVLIFVLSINIVSAQNSVSNENDQSVQMRNRQENVTREQQQAIEIRDRAMMANEEGSEGVVREAQMLREEMQNRENMRESIQDRQQRVEDAISERQSQMQERREQMLQNAEVRRAKLSEERQARVKNLIGNIFNSLTNATDRLDNAALRIEDRVELLSNEGIDIGNANQILDEAFLSIDLIKSEIELVNEELNEALEGEVSAEYVRELVSVIRNRILNVQMLLKSAITEINNK